MSTDKFFFPFCEIDSDRSLGELAHYLGATFLNGCILIPPESGSGIIRRTELEKGLRLRAWNFQLNKPFVFNKEPDTQSADRVFHIAYILNPEALLIKTKGMEKPFRVQAGMNILFVSNDISIEVEVETDTGLHAIDISFTASWLIKSFAGANTKVASFVNELIASPAPTVFFESTCVQEYKTLADTYTMSLEDDGHFLGIKAGAFSLLSDFFDKILSKSSSEVLESRFFYYDKMLEVEKLLASHLEKKLPSIGIISRQMALSVSTLKRHFKLMFNKSIYEYYLEMKMDHAKRILMERSVSINEVAAMLDYEKVSSFIDMFKRHHGVSPGSFRRKIA